MTNPNINILDQQNQSETQNQSDQNNQNQNQPPVSNTPTVVYDPRVDSVIAQQARILELLEKQATPAAPIAPQYQPTDDDFREKPAEVISRLVNQAVETHSSRLVNDINKQLTPINDYIGQGRREQSANGIIAQLKGNPHFAKLSEPAVEQAFRQALMNYTGNVDVNVVGQLYLMAVGSANLGFVTNPTTSQSPAAPRNTPAYIPPDNKQRTSSSGGLPALSADQAQIAKSNGWSHARACYMYELITEEQYKQLEPNGRLKFNV